ncbi:hypothetical protein FRC08_000136, partial [Ceratobasidium sp. 394]
WEKAFRDDIWRSAVGGGLSALSNIYEAAQGQQPFILRIHSALRPDTQWPAKGLICELEQGLWQPTEVSQACNAVLWYSDMGLAVDHVPCRKVREVAVGTLKVKTQSEDLLLELVSHAISGHEQELQASKLSRIQQCIQHRIHLIQEFEYFLSSVRRAKELATEFPPSEPPSHSDPPQSHPGSPQPHPNQSQLPPDPCIPYTDLSLPLLTISQFSVWLTYGKIFALWTLHVVLSFFGINLLCSAQPTQCVFIEDELESHLAILKVPKCRNKDETTSILQKLRSLVAAPQLYLWKEWPWDHIYKPIRHHVLESLPREEEVLKISFLNSDNQVMTVSKFQQHLLKRIRDHAERVESFKLGSAAKIRDEMENKISQVWGLIRPDDAIPLYSGRGRTRTLLEEWLDSPNPAPISLPEFKDQEHKIPVVFEALVRHVSCHRLGIHEYILVHCSITLPATQRAITAYFRLERNPTEKAPQLLGMKSDSGADVIRMSVNAETLHSKHSLAVRGYIVFNQEDNVPKPLMLKHILEMYEYLARASHTYTIFGTNCRWLCLGLLECLRDCKPCFGGQWFECGRKDSVPKQDNAVAMIQTKTRYLKEKHPDCCHPRPSQFSSIMAALVAEANAIGAAVSNMVEMANTQIPAPAPGPTDPNVIYSTTGPAVPVPQPTQLPSGDAYPTPGHVHSPPTHPLPPTWVLPLPPPNFGAHSSSQRFGDQPTGYTQYLGVANGGYQPQIPTWSGAATGPCSCLECVSQTSHSSMTSDRSYPPQAPPNYHHHIGPSAHLPRAARGFLHHTTYARRQPAPTMGPLYGIPEEFISDMIPEHVSNQHACRSSVFGQPLVGCSNCSYCAATPAPMPQNTFTLPRAHPESTYRQGPNDGLTDSSYQNVSSLTVHSDIQPQHPRLTRWFAQDSTTGAPSHAESSTSGGSLQQLEPRGARESNKDSPSSQLNSAERTITTSPQS